MYVLAPDALDANRRGELTDGQRRGLGAVVRSSRRSHLTFAVLFAAIAVLIACSASHRVSRIERTAFAAGGFAIAAILLLRAASGGAVNRDLRAGRVEAIDGAIGRSKVYSKNNSARFLHVGGRRFKAARSTFEAAPDAGYVRLYFLPRSRKIVNLEQLADRPVAEGDVSVMGVARAIGGVLGASSGQPRDEARAAVAGLGRAIEAMFSQQAVPPPVEARDRRPLAEAILGKWTNGFLVVEFAANGTATLLVAGNEQRSRWSVGSDGRLHADLADGPTVAEAWVVGDQLTIALGGQGMTLRRT